MCKTPKNIEPFFTPKIQKSPISSGKIAHFASQLLAEKAATLRNL